MRHFRLTHRRFFHDVSSPVGTCEIGESGLKLWLETKLPAGLTYESVRSDVRDRINLSWDKLQTGDSLWSPESGIEITRIQ